MRVGGTGAVDGFASINELANVNGLSLDIDHGLHVGNMFDLTGVVTISGGSSVAERYYVDESVGVEGLSSVDDLVNFF